MEINRKPTSSPTHSDHHTQPLWQLPQSYSHPIPSIHLNLCQWGSQLSSPVKAIPSQFRCRCSNQTSGFTSNSNRIESSKPPWLFAYTILAVAALTGTEGQINDIREDKMGQNNDGDGGKTTWNNGGGKWQWWQGLNPWLRRRSPTHMFVSWESWESWVSSSWKTCILIDSSRSSWGGILATSIASSLRSRPWIRIEVWSWEPLDFDSVPEDQSGDKWHGFID